MTTTDSTLSVFAIEGTDVLGGGYVSVSYTTTSVSVSVTTTDAGATYTITGDTGLSAGNTSTVTVVVTAQDGVSQSTYTADVVVDPVPFVPSSDSSLTTFTIEGNDVLGGGYVSVSYTTTSVSVSVTTTDAGATYTITGDTGLSAGNTSTVTVVVTAQDGVSQSTYTADVVVDPVPFVPSSDSSLTTFTIEGNDVLGGGYVSVSYTTTSVSVSVTTTDAGATYTITGDTGLSAGNTSTVTVVVTAQDGVSQSTYTADVVVDPVPFVPSSDSSLSAFTIEGTDMLGVSSVTVAYGTTSVSISVTTTDAGATYTITGNNQLLTGSNTIYVVVTAQDGISQSNYSADVIVENLSVDPNTDATLQSLLINGYDVLYDANVPPLAYGTTTVSVVATPNINGAQVTSITGDTGLSTGSNLITVTVLARDNTTTQQYTYYVTVYGNTDSSLSAFTIEGTNVLPPGSVVNVSYNVSSVTVIPVTNDVNASYSISGNTGLQTGSNTITVFVTAEDGYTTSTYSAIVVVADNIVCFREDTKILCLIDGKDTYIPIQSMRNGTLVKTHLHGYVPVESIGYSKIYNPADSLRSKNRLYKLKQDRYPELAAPLYLTGCHSVLTNLLSQKETEDTIGLLGRVFITDDKYRLMACIDERAKPYAKEGLYTIWHFSLEHVDYYMNYGVYANGLLVESCSRRMMREYSGMTPVKGPRPTDKAPRPAKISCKN